MNTLGTRRTNYGVKNTIFIFFDDEQSRKHKITKNTNQDNKEQHTTKRLRNEFKRKIRKQKTKGYIRFQENEFSRNRLRNLIMNNLISSV